MNSQDRITLSQLVKQYGSDETTEKIRSLCHSEKIRNDVLKLLAIKKKNAINHKSDSDTKKEVKKHCYFLYSSYTDIFNKIYEEKMDVQVLFQLLDYLRDIEDGKMDQHESSYKVGMLLKHLYIDRKLDTEDIKTTHRENKNISWNEFKMLYKS